MKGAFRTLNKSGRILNSGLITYGPDEAATLMESVEEKCALLSVPGLQVKFDPEEAEQGKAFMANAQSEEDARTLLRRR